jgi:hypothetical protein
VTQVRIVSDRDRIHKCDHVIPGPELCDNKFAKIHKGESIRDFTQGYWSDLNFRQYSCMGRIHVLPDDLA